MKIKRIIPLAWIIALILLPTAFAASNVYFSGDTNVRWSPSTDGEWMGSVNAGSTLPFTGDTSVDGRGVTWYGVVFNGSNGWVSSKYASPTDHVGAATFSGGANTAMYDQGGVSGDSNGGTVVATGDVNVRTGPGTGYGTLGTLYKGQSLQSKGGIYLDTRGVERYEVVYGNDVGWVSSTYAVFYMNELTN